MSKTDPAEPIAEPTSSKADKPATLPPNTVTLDEPIVRGDQKITSVTVRKPAAGELRGISLADLLKLDVGALHTVLPRITAPTLTTQDVAQMDVADLAQLGSEVVGFFLTKADRASLFPTA